jgi:chitinase
LLIKVNWDAAASVPFVTVRSNNSYYCGYDNPKSIAIKAQWALNLGLKGVMFWDYDADDSNGTLRKAVWENIMKP